MKRFYKIIFSTLLINCLPATAQTSQSNLFVLEPLSGTSPLTVTVKAPPDLLIELSRAPKVNTGFLCGKTQSKWATLDWDDPSSPEQIVRSQHVFAIPGIYKVRALTSPYGPFVNPGTFSIYYIN